MITHADVAKWLRENADRQGTTEYDSALKAYKTLKAKSMKKTNGALEP